MTDCPHRFVFPEKVPREFKRVAIHAKCVGIKQTARDHKCVEFFRSRIFQRKIDIEFVAFVCMIHALNLTRLKRNDLCFCTGFDKRVPRFCHFHLLKAIRHKDGHSLSIEFSCHKISLLLMLIGAAVKIDRPKATKRTRLLDVVASSWYAWGTVSSVKLDQTIAAIIIFLWLS